jgi:hypothetical protein
MECITHFFIPMFISSISQLQYITKGYTAMGQNPIPLVNIKIAGKWMFIPLKMYL